MNFTLKQAFSLLDGRLSTEIGDVYEMLNFIFSDNLFTHQLPSAMRKLNEVNPKWFADGVQLIEKIKTELGGAMILKPLCVKSIVITRMLQ